MRRSVLLLLAMVALQKEGARAQSSPVLAKQIEMTDVIVSLKADSGDLIGVEWKRPHLQIIGESRLGENFRLLLPKPDYEANYFNSRDQVLKRIEKSADCV